MHAAEPKPGPQDVVDSLCRGSDSRFNATCVPIESIGAGVCMFAAP